MPHFSGSSVTPFKSQENFFSECFSDYIRSSETIFVSVWSNLSRGYPSKVGCLNLKNPERGSWERPLSKRLFIKCRQVLCFKYSSLTKSKLCLISEFERELVFSTWHVHWLGRNLSPSQWAPDLLAYPSKALNNWAIFQRIFTFGQHFKKYLGIFCLSHLGPLWCS